MGRQRTVYRIEGGRLWAYGVGFALWEHTMSAGGWASADATVPPPAWVRGRFRCQGDFAHLLRGG